MKKISFLVSLITIIILSNSVIASQPLGCPKVGNGHTKGTVLYMLKHNLNWARASIPSNIKYTKLQDYTSMSQNKAPKVNFRFAEVMLTHSKQQPRFIRCMYTVKGQELDLIYIVLKIMEEQLQLIIYSIIQVINLIIGLIQPIGLH